MEKPESLGIRNYDVVVAYLMLPALIQFEV